MLNKMENVAMGHKAKAQAGSWNGNKVYGYNNLKEKKRKTTLSINPDEAKVVQLIYASYIAGSGLRAIANDLNNKGYTTKRGNPFSSVSIRDILDSKTWDKVAQLRQLRSRNPEKSRTGANLLTGIIKCPQCGGHMVINNSYYTKKDGTRVHKKYYVCGTFKNKGAMVCSSNGINAETAEQKVAERFAELIDSKKLLEHLLVKMQETSNEGKDQLRQKQKLLTDKIISCNNHVLVYQEKIESEPNLADIWEEAIHRLEAEIEDFKEEIMRIDQRLKKDYSDYDIRQITHLVNALVETAKTAKDKSQLKDIYLAFIKEIQWDKDTQKFDILLYFDEGNIAEYLGIKPHPDPDYRTQDIGHETNSSKQENLPDGGFFLRRPIEIWV